MTEQGNKAHVTYNCPKTRAATKHSICITFRNDLNQLEI